MLVEHFVENAARRHGRSKPRFTSAVTRRLLDYPWPGNVRELENTIERLVLLAESDSVALEDLPEGFASKTVGAGGFKLPPSGMAWEEHERSVLQQAHQIQVSSVLRYLLVPARRKRMRRRPAQT